MLTKSTVAVFTVGLLFSLSAHATALNIPQTPMEKAIMDAMQAMLQNVPSMNNQVQNNINQAQNNINSLGQSILSSEKSAVQQIANEWQAMGQAASQGYKTLGSDMLGSVSSMGASYATAYNQLDAILAAFDGQYCTPAQFIPSVKKNAQFTGHKFELTLSSGDCFVNETALLFENSKELVCQEPAVILSKYPANFTSKYKSAPKFISKSCMVTKTFGEPIEKVLFIFDGQHPLDLNALTNTVMNEVRSALGGVASAHNSLKDQMAKFLNSMPVIGGNSISGIGGYHTVSGVSGARMPPIP